MLSLPSLPFSDFFSCVLVVRNVRIEVNQILVVKEFEIMYAYLSTIKNVILRSYVHVLKFI